MLLHNVCIHSLIYFLCHLSVGFLYPLYFQQINCYAKPHKIVIKYSSHTVCKLFLNHLWLVWNLPLPNEQILMLAFLMISLVLSTHFRWLVPTVLRSYVFFIVSNFSLLLSFLVLNFNLSVNFNILLLVFFIFN